MAKPSTEPKPAKPKNDASGLNPKHARFVAEYLIDQNATKAYIRAGYGSRGNSAKSAAQRLLTNVDIQCAIVAGQTKTLDKLELTRERVLLEVARLAYFDPRKLLNADGQPKPINELDDDTAACIAGIEILEQFEGAGKDRVLVGSLKKYKVFDKNSALDKAMKALNLMTDKLEVTGPNGGPIESKTQVTVYMPANGR